MSDIAPTTAYAHGPGGLLSQPGLGGKRQQRLAKRVRTKALSPKATVARLWASGVNPDDITGIWYSPSDGAWFVSGGDWAAPGTGDKVESVFGPGVIWADEGAPNQRSDESKFSVRVKAWSPEARAAALAARRRNAAMNAPNADARNLANARHDAAQLAKVPKQPKIAAPKHGGGKGGKGPKAAKPKKVALTTEQKRAARLATRAQNRADTLSKMQIAPDGQQALDALRNGEQPDPAAIARGGFVAAGLVTQAADGSYHMTPSGRAMLSAADAGDAGRAGDTVSGARDRATAAAKPPKPPKGGGGGGGKKTPTPEQKRQQQQQQRTETAASTAPEVGLAAADVDALRQAAETGGASSATLTKSGLIDSDGQATDAGRMALSALERGDVRGYRAAIQNARGAIDRAQSRADRQTQQQRDRHARETRQAARDAQRAQDRLDRLARIAARRERAVPRPHSYVVHKAASSAGDYLVAEDPDKPSTWHLQVKRDGKLDHGLMGSAWAALHTGFRGNTYQGPNKGAALSKLRQLYEREGMDVPATKAATFAVFKDSAGAYRWVMLSSNSFRDRDNEIVSTKALDADVARADSDHDYGPLRWWHVGVPFGPGLDLGDCDFNAMVGKMLIESGTFRSPQFASAIAAKADRLQGSIGFTHPFDEPDREGVFWHIRRFERSLVPAGKAANPFTQLYVQEIPMDETKVKELAELLNIPIEQVQGLVAATQTKETKIAASGVAFKAAAADPGDASDVVTEDALPPDALDAEDAAEGDELGGGDENMLTDAECSHIADMVVAKLGPMLDLEKKMAGHANDIKTAMGGMLGQHTAQKDASDAELKAQIASLQARLKELEGDQPKATKGYRASLDTATVTKDNTVPAPTGDPLNTFVNDFILGGAQPRQ